MSIQIYDKIDLKKINFMKPEKQGLIYYAPINYNNQPFYIQTPRLICKTNGVELLDNKKKTNIDFETLNNDYSFYDLLLNLDERNIKETFKNNKNWFKKDIPLEIIDDMYKRISKPVKKDKKPIFTFKVPMIKDKIQCQLYNQKKTFIDIDKLTEGCEIICILHIKGLKFLKQNYYCDCYISQMKVFLEKDIKYSILDNYSFNDEDEDKQELIELDKDLRLDEEIIYYLNKEKEEENKKKEEQLLIKSELEKAKKLYDEQKNKINQLENKLNAIE